VSSGVALLLLLFLLLFLLLLLLLLLFHLLLFHLLLFHLLLPTNKKRMNGVLHAPSFLLLVSILNVGARRRYSIQPIHEREERVTRTIT